MTVSATAMFNDNDRDADSEPRKESQNETESDNSKKSDTEALHTQASEIDFSEHTASATSDSENHPSNP